MGDAVESLQLQGQTHVGRANLQKALGVMRDARQLVIVDPSDPDVIPDDGKAPVPAVDDGAREDAATELATLAAHAQRQQAVPQNKMVSCVNCHQRGPVASYEMCGGCEFMWCPKCRTTCKRGSTDGAPDEHQNLLQAFAVDEKGESLKMICWDCSEKVARKMERKQKKLEEKREKEKSENLWNVYRKERKMEEPKE